MTAESGIAEPGKIPVARQRPVQMSIARNKNSGSGVLYAILAEVI
jgi:hypothetical protein